MSTTTTALFDPPQTHTRAHKRPHASHPLRSLQAKTSRSSSKASNSSKDSLFSDLLGIKSRHTPTEILPDIEDSPTLKFSSSASISTESTTSSSSSNTSTTTKASSISLTDHDLFGIKIRSGKEEVQEEPGMNGVELGGHVYWVPEDVEKQFYRDLTFLEDEELVKKYGLVKVDADHADGEEEESGGGQEKKEPVPEVSITKFV